MQMPSGVLYSVRLGSDSIAAVFSSRTINAHSDNGSSGDEISARSEMRKVWNCLTQFEATKVTDPRRSERLQYQDSPFVFVSGSKRLHLRKRGGITGLVLKQETGKELAVYWGEDIGFVCNVPGEKVLSALYSVWRYDVFRLAFLSLNTPISVDGSRLDKERLFGGHAGVDDGDVDMGDVSLASTSHDTRARGLDGSIHSDTS
jgi:hypothetical protein